MVDPLVDCVAIGHSAMADQVEAEILVDNTRMLTSPMTQNQIALIFNTFFPDVIQSYTVKFDIRPGKRYFLNRDDKEALLRDLVRYMYDDDQEALIKELDDAKANDVNKV